MYAASGGRRKRGRTNATSLPRAETGRPVRGDSRTEIPADHPSTGKAQNDSKSKPVRLKAISFPVNPDICAGAEPEFLNGIFLLFQRLQKRGAAADDAVWRNHPEQNCITPGEVGENGRIGEDGDNVA
jgi:hypothetical protein